MSLTNLKIQGARPSDKPWKLSDEKGLFSSFQPNGGKWSRFKYRFNGKEKLLALGTFPEISLANARELRYEACTGNITSNGLKRRLKNEVWIALTFRKKISTPSMFAWLGSIMVSYARHFSFHKLGL
jgi:hypothetical protein